MLTTIKINPIGGGGGVVTLYVGMACPELGHRKLSSNEVFVYVSDDWLFPSGK